MRKIFIFILCVMLICVTPVCAFAAETSTDAVTEDKPITEEIADYIKSHVEELTVIATIIFGSIYESRTRRKMNGTIGTLNNNAITVAENSADAIKKMLADTKVLAEAVIGYKEKIDALLAEVQKNAEEKEALEETLASVNTFLKSAKLATLELSNEVAELLVLSNIPNSKKDELYARHTKAVHELESAEEVMNHDVKEA